VRPRCGDYAFVRRSTMAQHDARHRVVADGEERPTSTTVVSRSSRPVPIVPRPPAVAPAAVALLPPGARSMTSILAGPSLIASTSFAGVAKKAYTQCESTGGSTDLTARLTGVASARPLLIAGLPPTPSTAAATVPLAATAVTLPGVRARLVSAVPTSVIVVASGAQSRPSRPPLGASSPPAATAWGASGRPFSTSKQQQGDRDRYRARCDVAFSDAGRLDAHSPPVHRVTADIDVEPTDLSGSTRASPPSSASSDQQQPGTGQNAHNPTTTDDAGELYDNDNDNDNGNELAIDLTSPGEARSPSDV